MTIAERLQALYSNLVISLNFINEGIQQKADKPMLATATQTVVKDSTEQESTAKLTLAISRLYNLGDLDDYLDDQASPYPITAVMIDLSATGAVTNECPEWHFFFTAGANAPLWVQTITWTATPTFTEGKRYEISIILVDSTYDGVVLENEDAE